METHNILNQAIVPNGANSHIAIPQQWYGRKVRVVIYPYEDAEDEPLPNAVFSENESMSEWEKNKAAADAMFDKYRFSMKNFKFDRNEANNYE